MSNASVGIVDYGMGNIQSVRNALETINFRVTKVDTFKDFESFDVMLVPGVGEFGTAINELEQRELKVPIADYLQESKPFVGICLGMQILFDTSEESSYKKGFGYFGGSLNNLSNLRQGIPVPSVGWQTITRKNEASPFIREAYLVHEYYAELTNPEDVNSTYDFGNYQIPTHVGQGSVQGVQFHPEKSGQPGLRFLQSMILSTLERA